MRKFNTTGVCVPCKHYMVDLTSRLQKTKEMVDAGDYFAINRGRQYGKTTLLVALRGYLAAEYAVASLDFQGIPSEDYASERSFSRSFAAMLVRRCKLMGVELPDGILLELEGIAQNGDGTGGLSALFDVLMQWCAQSQKPAVLVIDEVDSATNSQVFLDFLGMLRQSYIDRDAFGAPAFQSVILAAVTDVRHLRSRIRDEDQHRVNSPWDIAIEYELDMSFSAGEIEGMLRDYEADHSTGMDVSAVAGVIRDWTGGYPFLTSRVCQILDESADLSRKLPDAAARWTPQGVDEAVKVLLDERNALFDSLAGKLVNYPEVKQSLRDILMAGERVPYSPDRDDIVQFEMYGFVKRVGGSVQVANRVFETRLYNLFMADEQLGGNRFNEAGDAGRNMFIKDGKLDMRLVLEGFRRTYTEVFGPLGERFPEKDGRELFLLYLKPIINGTGNFYIEAQTRDQTRTDVIVDYLGERFVVELKIWRGPRYNEAGERQVADYLDYFGLTTGYMLSFNFNKSKEVGLKRVHVGDKLLFEETI